MEKLTPDRGFVKKLKEISPQLEVEWAQILERWVIWYTGSDGRRWRIHEVKNPNGSFRPLDERVLEMLRRADMSTKVEDPNYLVSEQLQNAKREKAKAILKYREEAMERSLDMQSKWNKAIDNAVYKNIFNDSQLDNRTIYSFGSDTTFNPKSILAQLGTPQLTGAPVLINP